ncbi:MAG: flagellar basal-body MS-ring/collar protein FliF [Pseudomonadota bacterium]
MANTIETANQATRSEPGTPSGADRGNAIAGSIAAIRMLGPGHIMALGLVALALIGFFSFIVFRFTEPNYTLLFGSLELDDSRAIIERLEARDIPFRLSQNGRAILVPEDQALRLRMDMMEEDLGGGSTLGYEIFDRDAMFGTTDFVSNINLKRALEGELARTIASLDPVRSARVHLVLPERELFRPESEPPSASVFLKLRGSAGLNTKQIQGIQHLVASAVPGLEPSRVAILDGQGRLLARGDDQSATAALSAEEDHRVATEERFKNKIVHLLERTLGPGKVEAQVTAQMSFEEVTTSEEIYDPESQVARSTQAVEEETKIDERDADASVSVANALPGAAPAAGEGPGSSENTVRTEETTNYEISRTVRNETRRGGAIERLSVAVQVDGRYVEDDAGAMVFEPLSPEELGEIEALVASAIGIDETRGDRLQVASLPFHRPELPEAEEAPMLSLDEADYWRIGELGLLTLLTLLVLQFAVRPIIKGVFANRSLSASGGHAAIAANPGQNAQLGHQGEASIPMAVATGPDLGGDGIIPMRNAFDPDGGQVGEAAGEEMVSLKQIAGKVRASLVQEVTEIIEERPDDATRVVRGWLHSD